MFDYLHGRLNHSRRVRVLAQHLIALLEPHSHALVIGTGDGWLARRIMQERPDLTIEGIDTLVRKQTHIPVTAFDGVNIPFPDQSFDAILFIDVLHHADNAAELLRQAVRVSRKHVIIKDHLCDTPLDRTILKFMDRTSNLRYGVALPYNYLSRRQWRDLRTLHGCTVDMYRERLGLYPGPARFLFERHMQFIARWVTPHAPEGQAAEIQPPLAHATLNPDFDSYAEGYDEALNRGIAVSGEDKEYFAQRRIAWTTKRLREVKVQPASVLDFGCGTGSAAPFLRHNFPRAQLVGTDISGKSLMTARRRNAKTDITFHTLHDYHPSEQFELAYCNGVFHHIPPDQRHAACNFVYEALKPGGYFAFWENNPWNPGTRIVMSRIPFDKTAITLSPPDAKALLRSAGFDIVSTEAIFIFPHGLKFLRFLEPWLCKLPLGAQYLILARRP